VCGQNILNAFLPEGGLIMCKKFVFLISLILLLVPAGNVIAQLEPSAINTGHVYLLDNVSGGQVPDDSANSNTGTIVGDPQVVDGLNGKALKFDGVDDGVDIPDSQYINVTDGPWPNRTIVAVFNCADVNKSEKQTVYEEGGRTRGLTIYVFEGQVYVGGWNRAEYNWNGAWLSAPINSNEWHAVALVIRDGTEAVEDDKFEMWMDGDLIAKAPGGQIHNHSNDNAIGYTNQNNVFHDDDGSGDGFYFEGIIDEVWILNESLTPPILGALMGKAWPYAYGPEPSDGVVVNDTWVALSWKPGDLAVSHDVYFGESFDDVNNGTGDTFRGNQDDLFFIAGLPGYPYPDVLVPGTTYYWRIDEVNEAEPNSPWKGDVWSFSIPPKTAYDPVPADGAEFVDLNVQLTWTGGFGSKLHYIVFGEDFDEVTNAAMGVPVGMANYSPGPLELAKTYYWRVDEYDAANTYKGEVWSFTTEGAVSGPNPVDGAVDVSPTQVLTWDAGAVAASHEVYFGTDADAVANATKSSPEYKGPKALGEESYDPGKLMLNTTYYWRIDEVNDNPNSPWAGKVWGFTTGDFFVLDDFEHYDANDNQIWFAWHDGLGYGAPGTDNYFAGNGTGAAVGDENTPSYTEETIVHGGNQSMPLAYDNNKQGYAYYSEVEYTLTDQRDWTEEGVAILSIWFRGNPASVGGFIEGPAGTYTMTATGADIWNQADEFHYAYKMLTGVGTIVAKVESVEQTDNWAKAGVMIRETLDPGSKFAAVYITPGNGCRFQARTDTDINATSDTSVATTEQRAITAPYWVKLERDIAGNFRGYYSANGSNWTPMSWNPQFITMSSNVYIGLALTSHNNNATCEAKFSNVIITGNVSGQWTNQDIGIESNAAEPLYVAVSNTAGQPAVVVHDDPAAANIDTWTEWLIPLSAFADQGIDLTNVDRIAIGLGTRGNMTVPGGSGKMYFDDIRLYQPRESAE